MGIIRYIKSRLTMRLISSMFIDGVNGRTVYKYTDVYGINFMAQSRYGLRVKIK